MKFRLLKLLNLGKWRFSSGVNDERAHLAEGLALALDIFEDLEAKRNSKWANVI